MLMKKINIQDWKEFKIEDLFELVKLNKLNPEDSRKFRTLEETEKNTIPAIVAKKGNNGVMYYVAKEDYETTSNKLVIIGDGAVASGLVYYHESEFTILHNAYAIDIKDKGEYSRYIFLFLKTIIQTMIYHQYGYEEKPTWNKVKLNTIYIPVNINGEPDWEYMERYVKQLYTRERESSEHVTTYVKKSKSYKIDITKWKRFNLYDEYLFDIDSGTKLDKVKMTAISPKVNFIGRSNFNNGITEKVDLIKGIEPYEAGNLTLSLGGAYLGSCFVQKEPFYTSQNVVVLIPKLRMSEYCKKFIATMVFKESQTYYKAFENELNRHIKSDFSIYLPVKTDNSPDWEYMETYMRNLEKTLKNMIKANNHSVNVS
jgi:putative S-cspCI